MPIADDSERLAADLPATLGLLVPRPGLHLERALEVLARQCDDLGNYKLGNRARIGEGRVEDGDASLCSGEQVDLVDTNAETADDEELASGRCKERR